MTRRRDVLDRRLRPRGGAVGRRRAVEVPRRSGSVVPWAEPGVGAIATQAYANPRYGPDGLALLRDGLSAEEVVRAAHRRRRRASRAAARRRRRHRAAARAGPGRSATTGRDIAPAPATRRRATSSSAPRRSTRSRRRSRRTRTCRSRSACSNASPRHRLPAATGAASSRPPSSSCSETAATPGLSDTRRRPARRRPSSARSRSCAGSTALHGRLFGTDAARGVAAARRRARTEVRRAARATRLRRRPRRRAHWAGSREPRRARRRRRRDRPGRPRRAAEGECT